MLDAHALLIGISDYRVARKLHKARQDARSIYSTLIDPAYCGYPASQVSLLEDGAASGDNILRELDALAQRAGTGSTCFIAFAGHGARVRSGPQAGEYLVPVEGDMSTADALHHTAIAGSVFTEKLRQIPARKLVVVLDCCHSAGAADPRSDDAALPRSGLSDEFETELARGSGRVIFAAARHDEASYERAQDDNGLFTRHLLDGLRGAAGQANDRFIRVFNLFTYVQPRVTADEPRQHPVLKVDLEENFPLAMCAGGRGLESPTAQAAQTPPRPAAPPLASYSRDAVLALLYRLLPTQFDELLFRLNVPPQHEPSYYLTQGQRAIALLRWAEQPESGPGLQDVVRRLREILPSL